MSEEGNNTLPAEADGGKTVEMLKFEPMLIKDLHEVYFIEQSVFSYHWNYRNFMSSVAAGRRWLGHAKRDGQTDRLFHSAGNRR